MESTKNYERFAVLATADGHRPGSGEWWAALRAHRQAARNIEQSHR